MKPLTQENPSSSYDLLTWISRLIRIPFASLSILSAN